MNITFEKNIVFQAGFSIQNTEIKKNIQDWKIWDTNSTGFSESIINIGLVSGLQLI